MFHRYELNPLNTAWIMTYYLGLICLLLAGQSLFGQDIADPELPEGGTGVASHFPRDEGIGGHEDVIFYENFEAANYKEKWGEARDKDLRVLSRERHTGDEAGLFGDYCLKVSADLKENSGGGLTTWFESADMVFIRYYTKFDINCDYVHHFGILRANKSLQGADKWSGFGGAGKKPIGNERFTTALEPWGNWGRYPAPGAWNFYSYWHEMKMSGDGNYWGNSFAPETPIPVPKDEWICLEFMLDHNTPGKADGSQAFWINGRLSGFWSGINWRTNASLNANSFTLEAYVTDRWTKNRFNTVYFDNLVIAKSYIGPIQP